MKEVTNNMTGHGGARVGAGRKRQGEAKKVPLNLKILPEAKERLKALAQQSNQSQAVYLEKMIMREKLNKS